MKKLLLTLLATFSLYAGSDQALFDLDLKDWVASGGVTVYRLQNTDLLEVDYRIGYALDEHQTLFINKGGLISTYAAKAVPANLVYGHESLDYSYRIDLGMPLDLALGISAGDLYLADASTQLPLGFHFDLAVSAILNLTTSIQLALRYSQRNTSFSESDLALLSLTKSEIDSQYISIFINAVAF